MFLCPSSCLVCCLSVSWFPVCVLRPTLLIDWYIQCVSLLVYVSVSVMVVSSIVIYLSCYHFWCTFIQFHRSCMFYLIAVVSVCVCLCLVSVGLCYFSVRRLRTLVWEVSVDLGCPSVGLCVNLCSRWRCLFQLGRQRLACII